MLLSKTLKLWKTSITVCLLTVFPLSVHGQSQDVITFVEETFIAAQDASYDNKHIVIDGAVVTIDGEHSFLSIRIINEGTLTHSVDQYLSLDVSGGVVVEQTSRIDVSGKGWLRDDDAGRFTGGSHAGLGGLRYENEPPTGGYGNYQEPTTPGRGGRHSNATAGGITRGGGAIKLVADSLQLDGQILANGDQWSGNTSNNDGGGAGGSIWLDVNTLTSDSESVVISANGGLGRYGGGGGGRVAVYHQFSTPIEDFNITAYGGGRNVTSGTRGGPGTVYIKEKGSTEAPVLSILGSWESLYSETHFEEWFDGDRLVIEDANLRALGDFHLPSIPKVAGSGSSTLIVDGKLTAMDDALVIDGITLVLQQNQEFESVVIKNNGVLTTPVASEDFQNGITLTAGSITVEEGSRIDVSGKGLLRDDEAGRSSGGSHGGLGGQYYNDELPADVYGNYQEPITAGLGGRSNSTNGGGTVRGGGVIKLVADSVLLNGQILANGGNSSSWTNGGGAGGSIWLEVNSLVAESEEAVLRANGGTSSGAGSGGGGGRVALYYEQLEGLTETDIHVLGGSNSSSSVSRGRGGAGTVYLKDKTGTMTHPFRIKGHGSGEAYAKTPLDNLASEPHLIIEDAVVELLGVDILSSLIESSGSDIYVNNAVTIDAAVSLENSNLYLAADVTLNSSLSTQGSAIHITGNADIHTELNLKNSSLSVLGDLTLTEALSGNGSASSTVEVGGRLSVPNNELVVDGITLSLTHDHEFTSIVIKNNGVLTTPAATENFLNGITLTAASITVEEGSRIDVSGKGLLPDDGAGRYTGGSHGGLGGHYYNNEPPVEVYGNYQEPITVGRGGRNNSTNGGGTVRGGGAIKLIAESLTLNGQLLANGENLGNIFGGGAGGSIWLDINNLVAESEEAAISANGATGYYGGGGGGRIAVYYAQLAGFTESDVQALGGNPVNISGIRGGAGTVYLKDKTGTVIHPFRVKGLGSGSGYARTPLDNLASESHLIIDDSVVELLGVDTLNSIIESRGSDVHVNNALRLDAVVSLENSNLYLAGDATLNSSLSTEGSGIHIAGDADVHTELNLQNSSLSVSRDLTLTEALSGNGSTNSTVEVGGRLIAPNNELVVDGITLSLTHDHEFTSIVIKNNGVLTTPVATENFLNGVTLTASSIIVEEGSRIDVSGKGLLADDEAGRSSGGSHGGLGGQYHNDAPPAEVYGDYQEPITAGLGGRSNSANGGGTVRGGGVIKLVADSVLLNGQILANGENGSRALNGGGAGGSVWLDVNSLVASSEEAAIRANGGINSTNGSGGGGGRIALYYEQLERLTETDIHVLGGSTSISSLTGRRGGTGTVYLKDKTGTVTHPFRIKGHGSGDAYAKTPLDNLASEPHLIIEDAVIELLDVDVLASIIESRGSDIHVNNALTLDAAVSLENSNLYLAADVTLNSSLSTQGSAIHITGNADVFTELNLQDSSLSVLGDLTLTEALSGNGSTNSAVEVGGRLIAPNNELVVDGITLSLTHDHEFTSIVIKNNGVLTTPVASEHFQNGITLTASSITVEEGSRIDVSGKGLLPDDGAGRYTGGSHGGLGGHYYNNEPPVEVYGNYQEPITVGRGGRNSSTNGGGTVRGGGAIKLIAESLTLNGQVLANGENHSTSLGGGAGGSIWLDINNLVAASEEAAISANGGTGYYGGGGGGRIALYYQVLGDGVDERLSVLAGRVSTSLGTDGEPGTIYLQEKAAPPYIYNIDVSGFINQGIESIVIDFSVPMVIDSFEVSDAWVIDENGNTVYPVSIHALSEMSFQLNFPYVLPEGVYSLRVGPNIYAQNGELMDQNQNGVGGEADDAFVFDFVIDMQAPQTVAVDLPPAPAVTPSTSRTYTLSGTRDDSTSVWINGRQEVSLGSGSWSADLSLSERENTLEIVSRDAAGNLSEPVTIIIDVDSIAPSVVSRSPSVAYLATIPESISIQFREQGSGLDLESSKIAVAKDGSAVLGSLSVVGDVLHFHPQIPLAEGHYAFQPTLVDLYGNERVGSTYSFTIDYTPPAPPTVNNYPSVTSINTHTFTGAKEVDARVYVNGQLASGNWNSTTWSFQGPLAFGENTLVVTQRDRAGNESAPVEILITYNDEAPEPVIISVNPEGSGEDLFVSWVGYDEYKNGNDIAAYYVYIGTEPYSSISLGDATQQVPGGTQSTQLTDLQRDTQYFISVVAVNTQGLYESDVTPVAAIPVDVQPPENVSNLQVAPGDNDLVLRWQGSANTMGDLAHYQLRYQLEGETREVSLDPEVVEQAGTASYTLTELQTASAHQVRITAVDASGNESEGVSDPGVTLLANPTDTEADGLAGRVNLVWSRTEPYDLVDHYRVYVLPDNFTNVSGMQARSSVPGGSQARIQHAIAGLSDGEEVYVAVTAVNTSGGEHPSVTAVPVVPEEDTEGPEVDQVLYSQNGETTDFMLTPVLSHSGQLSVQASDPSGVSRIALLLNDEPLTTLTQASSGTYRHNLDVFALDDGEQALSIHAYDTLDNRSELTLHFTVSLASPAAPVITQPAEGTTTNREMLALEGTSVPGTRVRILNNGTVAIDEVAVNRRGEFGALLTLEEGENSITAQADYPGRSDWSTPSSARVVVLNTDVPDAPRGITATSRPQGEIQINWLEVTSRDGDNPVRGYNLYRAVAEFTALDQAGVERVNNQLITRTSYTDLVIIDGDYVYAVTAVNEVGSESAPSTNANAKADSSGPKIIELSYEPLGEHDPVTGRIAPGDVRVQAEFDQPLRNEPYFAMVPEGGSPITVDLRKSGTDTRYTGQFRITESTPSGTAYAVMSAYDSVGNRGTEILEGATIQIDTDGPELLELILSPGDPLKVDEVEGLSVNVAASLSDAIKPGTEPRLVPMLNQVPVIGYEEGIPLQADQIPGQDLPRWLGHFDLPVTAGRDDAGQPTVEQLSFEYTGYDDLNNAGQRIHGQRVFQVYQGDLPPLAVPTNLSAQARPEGRVQLTWNAVESAHAYVLYRQGPDDNELTELETLSDLQWEDAPSVEGTYLYAISSVRRDNQQEAISAPSDTVSVSTRRTAPKAPDNFELELNGAGIVSRWDAPQEDELGRPQPQDGLTYNLYRLAAAEDEQILSTDGLTPIQTGIPEPIALDSEPSESEHSYFVTAVDAAGNESLPSATEYLNVGLLPVRDLRIEFSEGEQPILSWRHDGQGISHYQVFRESDTLVEPVLLTDEPLNHTATSTEFVDARYSAQTSSNTQWRYSVVAVDNFGVESIANQIVLPALNLSLDNTDATLKRGVMNEVVFRVDNVGSETAQGIRLYVTVQDDGVERVHQSEPFSVAPGAFARVPVVVGGYDGLDGIADLELQLVQIPQPRSEVRLRSETALSVSDDLLSVELQTEDFTRGALGTAQFSLKNTSEVETEILMAENSGQRASSQVRLILEDMAGNVLATQAVQQYSGNVITLPNGNTVARLAPGETFTSAPITMEVPAAAPTQVRLRLAIDRLHYHSGRDTHVTIAGVGTRTTINLTETPYYAQVDEIAPELLYGAGQDVTITGRALSRASGAPQANVPVRLVVDVRGFERSFTVQTDADGEFYYDYRVDSGAGIYRVSAVHPDVQDRPNHGQFQVVGAEVSPRDIRVNIPRNYTQEIPIRVNAGHDSTLTNLRLTPVSADGVSIPQLPMGVTIELGTLNQLQPRGTGYLPLRFTGDNSANRTGTVRYRVEADHFTGDNALAEIKLDYTLSEARPAVVTKPAFIDTGLGLEDSITETVTLSNNGLDVLRSGQVELVDAHGAPAPSWINVLGSNSLGDLAVGDSRTLQIAINPNDQTTEGNHEFALRVLGENAQTHTVPVFVAVTQSGIGNAFFHVSDIYTATLDENNQPIPGLQGARIELQNEQVLTETYSLTTNALGEATFEGIPAGRYSYRASAFDHGSKSGRVWIRPGVTTSESVFLMNSLITIEWSVREITIEDRYEIKLEATFETNVPVAVVMFHPLSVQLPVMEQGDVFQGELTLTNHGLIRATNVRQTLPSSNDLVSFEFLRAVPEVLEAGEVFTLPYRVRALRDFNPEADAMATGGGCGSFNTQTRVNYQSECVNGEVVPSSTSVSWNSNWGRCTSPPKRDPVRSERSYSQPYSNGGIRMINRGGLGSMTEEPLWCMFVTECEDGNCDNASAK